MSDKKILPFPTFRDDIRFEDRMSEVARLAEEVAGILDTGDQEVTFRNTLSRLEAASEMLMQIGDLVLRGADKIRAEESLFKIEECVRRAKSALDIIDLAGTGCHG